MHKYLRRFKFVTLLALPLAAFATLSPASAAAPSDDLTWSGHANAAVLLTGGGGNFAVNSTVACNVVSHEDAPDSAGAEAHNDCSAGASASGTFTNNVCGTGTATVTSLNLSSTDGTLTLAAGQSLTLTFTATQGTVTGSATETDSEGSTTVTVTGTVSLTADGSNPGAPACTNGFNFVVNATATE
jgi:hypothetical protein